MKSVKAGEDEDNDGSGRRSMQYAETMKVSKKGEDADAMAEILRQRRSLPVYTVRGALLQIVRDNQVRPPRDLPSEEMSCVIVDCECLNPFDSSVGRDYCWRNW